PDRPARRLGEGRRVPLPDGERPRDPRRPPLRRPRQPTGAHEPEPLRGRARWPNRLPRRPLPRDRPDRLYRTRRGDREASARRGGGVGSRRSSMSLGKMDQAGPIIALARALAPALLALAATACGAGESPRPIEVERTDSAGVEVVTSSAEDH